MRLNSAPGRIHRSTALLWISYFIAFYTNQTLNWGMAAALGLVLLAVTLILYGVYTKLAGTSGLKWR